MDYEPDEIDSDGREEEEDLDADLYEGEEDLDDADDHRFGTIVAAPSFTTVTLVCFCFCMRWICFYFIFLGLRTYAF